MFCPEGHHIRRDTVVLTDAGIRCKHREHKGAPECGRLLYVLVCMSPRVFPWQSETPGLVYVAEVHHAELKYIEGQHMSLPEVMQFLGVSWSFKAKARRNLTLPPLR